MTHRVVSGGRFLTGGVFESDIVHRRSVAVLCILYMIRCSRMHPLYGALPVPYVPVRVTQRCLGGTSVYLIMCLFATEPRCTTGSLFPSQCPNGTILLTLYSIVWEWRVSRAGPKLFYCPCSIHFCLLLFFSPSLLSVYRLVLWGWGLWTDRV